MKATPLGDAGVEAMSKLTDERLVDLGVYWLTHAPEGMHDLMFAVAVVGSREEDGQGQID